MQEIDQEIEGFILAGGASTRMGREKARLTLAGITLIQRAASALGAVSQSVYLVGGTRKDNSGLSVLPDIYQINATKKHASIIGLHSALFHSKARWAAILACDLPFVTGELFVRLISLGGIGGKSKFDAIVPVQPDGRMQPLCAIYNRDLCFPRVAEMLAEDNRRLQDIFMRLRTRYVEFSEIGDLQGAKNFFFNVNTQKDLNVANAIANRLIMTENECGPKGSGREKEKDEFIHL